MTGVINMDIVPISSLLGSISGRTQPSLVLCRTSHKDHYVLMMLSVKVQQTLGEPDGFHNEGSDWSDRAIANFGIADG